MEIYSIALFTRLKVLISICYITLCPELISTVTDGLEEIFHNDYVNFSGFWIVILISRILMRMLDWSSHFYWISSYDKKVFEAEYVSNPDRLAEKQKKVIINLLDYLILEKADYNPAFYYLESFSKSDIDYPKIMEYSKSILSLHMMDELYFLKRREIRPSEESLEKYAGKFGTSNVDEMASLQHDYLRGKYEINDDWKIMYLIILKAALIQKTNKSDLMT